MDTAAPSEEVVPRRRMQRVDRARQLLEKAEELFTTLGFQGASMEDIAEAAGISKPVLYDHFSSKEHLFAAVVVKAGGELLNEVITAVLDTDSPQDALECGIRAYFTYIENHSALWAVVMNESSSSGAAAEVVEANRRLVAEYVAATIALETPGLDPVDTTIYAQAVIGACERIAIYRVNSAVLDTDTVTASVMNILWVGLGGVRKGERFARPLP